MRYEERGTLGWRRGKVGWRSLQEKGCGKLAGAVGLRLCFKNASMMREGMLRKVLALGEEGKEESGAWMRGGFSGGCEGNHGRWCKD